MKRKIGTFCLPQDTAGGSGNNQDDHTLCLPQDTASGSGNNHDDDAPQDTVLSPQDSAVIVNLKLN